MKHSKDFDEHYLLGVINSAKAIEVLKGLTVSGRESRFHPEDFKSLPVPKATPAQQAPIVERVQQLQALGLEFFHLQRSGWKIGNTVKGIAHLPAGVAKLPLAGAKMLWPLQPLDLDAKLNGMWVGEGGLNRRGGRNMRKVLESEAPAEAVEWLARQFASLDQETTWRMAEAKNLEIPSSPEEAIKALQALQSQEVDVKTKQAQFARLREEVDKLVAKLYKSK